MPLFRKKKEEELSNSDYGFPELEQLKESFERVKAELAAREAAEAANPALPELPEAPALGTTSPTLPELPELPEESEYEEELEEYEEPAELPKKPKPKAKPAAPKAKPKAARPLFIRVDRFKEILASTEVIGEKIETIEGIIQKLKDIREKESETMKQWESEIDELKARLELIEGTLEEVQ